MKVNEYNYGPRIFREVPDEGGGGSAADMLGELNDAGGSPDGDAQSDGGATPGGPAQPGATTTTVDAKALAQEFAAALGGVIPKPTDNAPQMTPEEAKKLLKVFEFTPEFFTQFDNLDTRQKAFETLRDGLLTQYDTVAQYRLAEMQQALEAKYGPVLEFMQSYQAEQQMSRFTSAYPQLANEKLHPLIDAVSNSLVKSGKRFNSEAEVFSAVASGVEAVIQQNNPAFKLTAATPTKTTTKTNPNAIPVTTSGGGGGGGNGGSAPTAGKPRALDLLGKAR